MKDIKTWEFTWIEKLYEEFLPATFYGKTEKKRKNFIVSEKRLEREYYLNEILLEFISKDENRCSLLKNTLKRIPRIDRFSRLDTGDIFIVKKFIFNLLRLIKLLDKKTCEAFGFDQKLEELFDRISLDGRKEQFAISDDYDDDLKNIRNEIRILDKKIKDISEKTLNKIKNECKLNFRFRDFILVDDNRAKDLKMRDDLFIEPYDNRDFIVKPIFNDDFIELNSERDELYAKEKKREGKVRKALSKVINSYQKDLKEAIETVGTFDITLARTELIKKYDLVRPKIISDCNISLKGARLIPLENWLGEEGLEYQRLDLVLDESVSIIRGSNMGGKTVLLKTVGFMQLLTQLGFFVPAKDFETRLFSKIVYIGQTRSDNINGLSSFGLEMKSLIDNLNDNNKEVLFLIDEFARTTNSSEASALIGALSWFISHETNSYALISTHFTDIKKNNGVSFFRMKGLDIEKYEKAFEKKSIDKDLNERLRLINEYMDYSPVREENIKKVEDALKIAKLLGVDDIIINKANEYLRR